MIFPFVVHYNAPADMRPPFASEQSGVRLRISPTHSACALILFEGLLWLAVGCGWFAFGEGKELVAVLAVAGVSAELISLVCWFLASRALRFRFSIGLPAMLLFVCGIVMASGLAARAFLHPQSQKQAIVDILASGGRVYFDADSDDAANLKLPDNPYTAVEPALARRIAEKSRSTTVRLVVLFKNVECVDRLPAFPLLPRLQILGALADNDLRYVEGLNQLEELTLLQTNITDAGMVHLLGLRKLRELNVSFTAVGDSAIARLSPLRQLILLDFGETHVTDAGLPSLNAWPGLKALGLAGTQVTDAGLEQLRSLSQLSSLHLGRSRITDASMRIVGSLTELADLSLESTAITDRGLAQLTGLAKLTSLDISRTSVTDDGLKQLAAMRGIKSLIVSRVPITGRGLEAIAPLAQLESLQIDSAGISNADLPKLGHFRNLKFLTLRSTKMTRKGFKQLREALPACKIEPPPEPDYDWRGRRIARPDDD